MRTLCRLTGLLTTLALAHPEPTDHSGMPMVLNAAESLE